MDTGSGEISNRFSNKNPAIPEMISENEKMYSAQSAYQNCQNEDWRTTIEFMNIPESHELTESKANLNHIFFWLLDFPDWFARSLTSPCLSV